MLLGLAAAAVGCAAREPKPAPPPGLLRGPDLAERGHRVRTPLKTTAARSAANSRDATADVVVVGGGVAGLSAAWRLAGSGLSVLGLELGERLGGTSASADSPAGAHPLGAHYITLPNPACRHVRRLLGELGVIEGWSGGRPRYRADALAWAPQERLYVAGAWQEGLWPEALATPEDEAQRLEFEAHCAAWSARLGEDGRRAFEIPVALSSQDPAIRALARQTFAAHAAAQGWTSPLLRWQLRYACRDDFGAEPEEVSAWAGLHYFCARAPDPATVDLGTRVLTWPGGNGFLVDGLAGQGRARWTTGAVARRVDVEGERVDVWFEGPELRRIRARHVVLAVPAGVASRLLGIDRGPAPQARPWRVTSLLVDRPPRARGLRAAWDSVPWDGDSLGFVTSSHQRGGEGAAVLTAYEPMSRGEAREAARGLLRLPRAEHVEQVLRQLEAGLPDLRSRVQTADVTLWGHGTVVPAPGLHSGDGLARLRAARPGISFAHSDLSGMSLFEEASWHGVRAAEEALAALGPAPESWL